MLGMASPLQCFGSMGDGQVGARVQLSTSELGVYAVIDLARQHGAALPATLKSALQAAGRMRGSGQWWGAGTNAARAIRSADSNGRSAASARTSRGQLEQD